MFEWHFRNWQAYIHTKIVDLCGFSVINAVKWRDAKILQYSTKVNILIKNWLIYTMFFVMLPN